MRSLDRRVPKVNEDGRTFDPGFQKGEVHVWELQSGKNLGGFRFDVESDTSVKTTGTWPLYELEQDLAIAAEVKIQKGLKEFATAK